MVSTPAGPTAPGRSSTAVNQVRISLTPGRYDETLLFAQQTHHIKRTGYFDQYGRLVAVSITDGSLGSGRAPRSIIACTAMVARPKR